MFLVGNEAIPLPIARGRYWVYSHKSILKYPSPSSSVSPHPNRRTKTTETSTDIYWRHNLSLQHSILFQAVLSPLSSAICKKYHVIARADTKDNRRYYEASSWPQGRSHNERLRGDWAQLAPSGCCFTCTSFVHKYTLKLLWGYKCKASLNVFKCFIAFFHAYELMSVWKVPWKYTRLVWYKGAW